MITNADNIQHWSNVPRTVMDAFGDEGDFARQHLLNPVILAMAGTISGKAILDAGCGQGYLSRLLARRGASVIGIEPAGSLIQYAIERERTESLGIQYIQADLTTCDDASHTVDVVIANMVLMDIPDFRAAMRNCFRVLRPNGSFIFSLTHPCFEEPESEYQAKGHIAVSEYFAEYSIKQQFGYAFHRPLSLYLNAVITYGGMIQEVIEPRLDPAHAQTVPERERNLHVPSFIIIHALKR
jgi:2-polyprenyl-3-methyl-5-hydroxy-6-metoxy-1,4-benzoquinol methylase